MLGFIVRLFAPVMLCAGLAFGQGTFGQIAFGGCYVTTFTLVDTSSVAANVTLSFYKDDGTPLSAPVQGAGSMATYAFTIPASGSQDVVLTTADATTVAGWAGMTTDGGVTVRGQAVYRCAIAGRPTYEAVVPLSTTGATLCIVPFPTSANPEVDLPYDNTAGLHTTSVAFANITSNSISVPIEFHDQNNTLLASDALNLGPLEHKAFDTTQNYAAVVGTKGILRVKMSPSIVTVVGFLFNPSGAFTTIIPITQ